MLTKGEMTGRYEKKIINMLGQSGILDHYFERGIKEWLKILAGKLQIKLQIIF